MNVDTETEMNERRLHGPSTTTQWMIDERARCIILLKFLHDTASIIFRDLYIRFFYICSRIHNHAEFGKLRTNELGMKIVDGLGPNGPWTVKKNALELL